eukprot:59848-Hanusia_phi.AAC.3
MFLYFTRDALSDSVDAVSCPAVLPTDSQSFYRSSSDVRALDNTSEGRDKQVAPSPWYEVSLLFVVDVAERVARLGAGVDLAADPHFKLAGDQVLAEASCCEGRVFVSQRRYDLTPALLDLTNCVLGSYEPVFS